MNFAPKSNRGQHPSEMFYFRIRADRRIKEIYWDDYTISHSREAMELRALIYKIRDIVKSKETYKKLPPATGGYD